MKSLDLINTLIEVAKNGNGIWRLQDCIEDFEIIKADLEIFLKIKQRLVCKWVERGRDVGNFGIDVAGYGFNAINEEIAVFDEICDGEDNCV